MNRKVWKVIPALDVTDMEALHRVVKAVADHPLIYGFKLGFSLGLAFGLPQVSETIRKYSAKPLIYDHQKAATDIPDTGKLFARVMSNAGMDEVILFPQAGPATEKAWIGAIQEAGMKVIVGGIMTHPEYRESEGGYLKDEAVIRMYRLAYEAGVRDFVVPLTKPQATLEIYKQIGMDDRCRFYSPGYGKQGGNPDRFGFIHTHYIIIGRSLLQADQPGRFLDKLQDELVRIES